MATSVPGASRLTSITGSAAEVHSSTTSALSAASCADYAEFPDAVPVRGVGRPHPDVGEAAHFLSVPQMRLTHLAEADDC